MTLPPIHLLPPKPEDQDELTKFLVWFVKQPVAHLRPPMAPGVITAHESVVTITIFRAGPFQVELVILLPNSPEWPGEHRHPDVDSYEVAWFADLPFTKNGKVCMGPELVIPVPTPDGLIATAHCVRLPPTDFHGTKAIPGGAALLSVQHWLHGVEPTSVGDNWLGEPTAPGHAKMLTAHNSASVP